jgi:transmembrane sensor
VKSNPASLVYGTGRGKIAAIASGRRDLRDGFDMTTGDRAERQLEEAMEWLMRLRDASADPALHTGFLAWLDEDAGNLRAWERAQQTWALLGETAPRHAGAWDADRSDRPSRDAHRAGRPILRARRRWGMAAGIAGLAVAALFFVFVMPSVLLRLQADHRTSAGELRQLTLADGSTVHLGAESAIGIRYTPERRIVTLLAGEAFFEVVPIPGRAFVVDADGLDVTVTGTAFDVRFVERALSVGVRNGTVGVRYRRASPALDTTLGAGDRVTVDRETGAVARERIEPSAVASWRDGQLFVDNVTVSQVVDELQRYQKGWIVIADDRLAAQRVTGLYDLRDPGRALRALVQPSGGTVREITPFLHVLSLP